mgnify:FL=1
MFRKFIVFFFFCFFSFSSYSQVVADFTSSVNNGCVGLQVEFSDISHGNPNVWQWDFGNGIVSNIQNPIITFSDPGFYNVKLYVSDGLTGSMILKESFVSIYDKPFIDFSVSDSLICASNSIDFINNTSTIPLIDSFYWDFGDGRHSLEVSPQYIYNDTGFFDISLYAAIGGCVDSLVLFNLVEVLSPVVAFHDIHDCDLPFEVEFNSNLIDADAWFWDFGDGNISSALNPVHNFSAKGDYQVSLTALNNNSGCNTMITKTVKIVEPIADFSVQNYNKFYEGCPPLYVEFEDHSIDQYYDFLWYGDGDSTNWIYNHTYDEPGYYSVKQVIVDVHRCKDTLIIDSMIHVLEPPYIEKLQDLTVCMNDSVQIFALGDSGTFNWIPNYGLNNYNVYNPICYVTDTTEYIFSLFDGDCFNYDTILINVDKNLPLVGFYTDETCIGSPVSFYNNSIVYDDAFYCSWDFGNGFVSNENNPVFEFNSQGKQVVTLSIEYDSTNCKSSFTDTIMIHNLPFANAGLDVVACEGDYVNLSASGGVLYDWGSGLSDVPNYNIQANQTNFYSVIVYDKNGCSYSDDVGVFVTPAPSINISDDVIICYGDTILLSASGGFEYNWNSGEYLTSDIFVSPDQNTTYQVEVTSINGCSSVQSIDVDVIDEIKPLFNVKDVLCVEDTFDIINITDLDTAFYYWDFGDGSFSDLKNPNHKFNQVGSYDISLYVEYGSCTSDEIFKSVQVYDNPYSDFHFNYNQMSDINSEALFTNYSNNYISSFWDFGDGFYSNESHPSHIYSDTGSYSVSLLVFNQYGCKSQKTINFQIKPNYSCYIPNSFTPNKDDINDYFLPKFNGVNEFQMSIYNKWGVLVFQTNSFEFGWDGKLESGKIAQSGIYIVQIKTHDLNNKFRKHSKEINLIY